MARPANSCCCCVASTLPHAYIDYTLRVDESHTAQQPQQQTATVHVYGSGNRPTVLKLGRGGSLDFEKKPSPQLDVEVHVIAQRNVLDALWLHRQRDEGRKSGQLQRGNTRPVEGVEDDSLPSSVWSYVCEMERSDILLTQLSKVALDKVEMRFTHAKSQLMTTTIPQQSTSKHYNPPTLPSQHSLPTSPSQSSPLNVATLPTPTITLPPLPPFVASSYLSPSHPLWHFLASCPTSRWRRFFPLHQLSVLCSLHRTSQLELRLEMELELELEIDFQTLARVHEKRTVSSSFARAVSSVALPSSAGAVDETEDGGLGASTDDGMGDGILRHPHAIRSGLGQQEVASALCRLLQGWSSITVSNSFFVFLPSPPASLPTDDDSPFSAQSLSDAFACFVSSSIPLVLVRLGWKTKFLAAITLAFHACDPQTRLTVTHSLAALVTNANITARKRRDKEVHRQDGWPTPQPGTTQQEEEKRQDEAEYVEGGDDRELLLNRVDSIASRRSSVPSLSPSVSALRRGGTVESVRPFGVIDQSIETIILRPSSIIAGGTSASLFHTLFPPPSPASRLLSTATSTAPSFSSSRQLLALLRSYMRYHSWMWELPSSVSMKSAVRLLRAARAEEGFVLVASISSSSTWLREIPIVQAAADERTEMDEAESEAFMRQLSTNTAIHSPTSPERPALMLRSISTPNLRHAALGAAQHVHSLPSLLSSSSPLALFPPSSQPPRTAGVPSSCFIQYSVTEIDATHIQTEVWMEPFYGVVHFPIPLPSDTPSSPFPRSPQRPHTAAFHTLTSEQLFVHLSSWLHSCDLHLLSAVSTFDSVRDLELNPDIAIQMARRAEGKGRGGRSKRQQQQWGLGDTYSSSGLALQLMDDFHATHGWDYDKDSRSRLLSRFTSAHCHPRLMLSIGTVSRLQGLLKAGSASALYAQLKAHGGSLSDMSQLGDRERSASAVSSLGPSHSSSMDELHNMSRMRRNSSAVSAAPSEDDDEGKRLTSPPANALHLTPSSHRGFALTSPVVVPLSSPVIVSPLVSPLPSLHAPLFSSPPRTARTTPPWTDATSEARRQEARKQRRLRHERELVPYSLTYLLECSPSLTLQLPLPALVPPSTDDMHPFSQAPNPAMIRTAPLSTAAVTPQRPPSVPHKEAQQRSPAPSAHSHSHSTSELPNIFVTPPSSSHTTHATYSSHSANNTPRQQPASNQLASHADSGSSSDAALCYSTSAECLHDMLVRTVRRLSDVELIEGRCFAQLVNEYTIVLALLPQQPMHSTRSGHNAAHGLRLGKAMRACSEENNKRKVEEDEERPRSQREKELDAYLDRLLALHSVQAEDDGESNGFSVALYECSRDEFSHPHIFWPEGDSLPVISSSLSLSSLHLSESHNSLLAVSRASSSVSPSPTPPRSPHLPPQSPQHDRSTDHTPLPQLPNSYTLCDGRGPPQLSPHKQALLMAHVRTNALRYLFSTPPLISHHLVATTHSDVLRALALASGTAHVVHAALSPAVTPNKDMQSPSPLLSPARSPVDRRKTAGRGGQLLTSPTTNRTAFQLDETIDEDGAKRATEDDDEEDGDQANGDITADTERDKASSAMGGEEKKEEEQDSGVERTVTPLQTPQQPQQQQLLPADSTPLATSFTPRLSLDEDEEEAGAASPAAAFSARLSAAHMRNYAKAVYMQLKRQPQLIDETDLQRSLQQCDEQEELIDLTSIQRPTEEHAAAAENGRAQKRHSNNPFSTVKVLDRLHEQLHDILTDRLVQLAGHELFVWKDAAADKEVSQQQPTAGLSILNMLAPTATASPSAAPLGGGARRGSVEELLHSSGSINSADGGGSDGSGNRSVDDDAKGEMAIFPLPLFVQLKAVVRPSTVGIAALNSLSAASGEQLPPMQLETAVTAETEWSELAVRMIAYQQPDWWTTLRPTSSAAGVLGEGVECVLAVKGCTLSPYSDRAPHSSTQRLAGLHSHSSVLDVTPAVDSPESTARSLTASGVKRGGALYSGMPAELRLAMQSLYHQIEQAVGECQAALS